MNNVIDILENKILENYPEVLDILLRDHTTQKNIIWATDNYENYGEDYSAKNQIMYENCQIITVRIQKDAVSQQILETIAAKRQ